MKRQRCLDTLFRTLQKSGKLYRAYPYSQISLESYEDILQSAFIYVVENIDRYEPEKSNFLTWFNNNLRWRMLDSYRANLAKVQIIPLDESIVLDELPSQLTLSNEFEEFVQEDPDQRFQNAHLRSCPGVNLQYLILKRLHGFSWAEISYGLGPPPISINTLSSFYNRNLTLLLPYIKKEFIDC
jgi:RNA polymerase sigma factor (sigma-70 family)